MKLRNTLILLVLVAGLFAYIKWVDVHKTSTGEGKEDEVQPAKYQDEKVTMITIKSRDGRVVQIAQRDGRWFLEAPLKDQAQEFDVKSLLGEMSGTRLARVSDTPPTKDQLKVYGLIKPEFTLKIDADVPLEISFGEETITKGTYYVKVEGRDLVYMATTSIREKLARKPEDWRNRTLSPIPVDQVKQVDIKTAKGVIELTKTGRYWNLAKPFKARADMQAMSDLLAYALNAQVQDFVTEAKDMGVYGLNEPRAVVTFLAEGSDTPAVLEIGAVKVDPDESKPPVKPENGKPAGLRTSKPPLVYVRMTGREGIVTVPGTVETLVTIQPNNLRDQNIMRIQETSANRITLDLPGKEKIVLERTLSKSQTSEEWVRKMPGKADQPVNNGAAGHLLTELATAKVEKFVADLASDLKGFGLDQPQLTVTVGDYSADNTAETSAGEREQARLLIGRGDSAGYYAKLADEPFIFTIPKVTVDDFWTDPIQWRPLTIEDLSPESIVGLDITRTGQPTLSLTRKGKEWVQLKGNGKVSQGAVEALVGTLASLHAVSWEGVTTSEDGLGNPNLTIAFTQADKKTGKLIIGALAPGQKWYATTEGDKGTFLIAGPHFDALNAALIESAKPAPDAGSNGGGTTPGSSPSGSNPPVVPPAEEGIKPTESPKPTEAPAGSVKPAPDVRPKGPQ